MESHPQQLKMVFAPPLYIPKDNPDRPNGDDANFASEEAQTIGVADGVGYGLRSGTDPGEYARQLMSHSQSTAEQRRGQLADPKAILSEAHARTTVRGSSTACIVTHHGGDDGGGVLRAANVGDSGFVVFRNNKAVFKSESQQRSFNHPYKLNQRGGKRYGPEIAAEIETAVEENDVIVLATDGLWDNVFTRDVEVALENVGGNVDNVVELERFLYDVTNMACSNCQFDSKESPFSLAAKLAGRFHEGGKPDDITVIVAQIVSTTRPS